MSQAAVTTSAPIYPAFVNFTRNPDGTVTVTARGDPKSHEGVHVCGGGEDKGKPGRCTPGDDACNNYCNMAPAKGPMADRPKPTTVHREGPISTLTLTAIEFDALRTAAAAI